VDAKTESLRESQAMPGGIGSRILHVTH
jgi:hypothetical protein